MAAGLAGALAALLVARALRPGGRALSVALAANLVSLALTFGLAEGLLRALAVRSPGKPA